MSLHHVYEVVRETKTKVINISTSLILVAMSLGGALPAFLTGTAYAAPNGDVIVRSNSTQGWSKGEQKENGTYNFVPDSNAPYGNGALQLETINSNDSKIQLKKSITPVRLSDLSQLSYYTKNLTGVTNAATSLQLSVSGTGLSTTLVYEPYYNGTVAQDGSWQQWNALNGGKFWSTKTSGGLTAGAGGSYATNFTLQHVIDLKPDAKVTQVLLSIGTYNPAWSTLADGLNINGTVYDFEALTPVTNISTGEQFTTIQSAIDDTDTVNGNTIAVDPGTYNESVTVNKSLTINGAQAGSDARSGRANISAESVVNGNFKITADNVTIDGFTITNANPINMNNGSSTHYTGDTVKNNILNVNGGRGVDVNSNNATISQNKFVINNGFAIWAGNSPWHNMSIVNNSMTGSSYLDMNFVGSYSYDATNSVNAASTNIVVSGNTSDTHTGNFLMSTFIDGFTVSGNTISNKTGSAIIIGGNDKNVSITGNTVSTTGSAVNVYQYIDSGHPTWPAWPVNGKITISNNDFSGSKNGVNVAPGSVDTTNLPVSALNNWWGNASGPTDGVSGDGSVPATNPSGSGAAAIGAVKYNVWCTTADCSTVNAPSTPSNFYFNKGQNDTTDRTLVDGSTTNTTPLVGTGSIAGQKYLWTHWDSQPNTVYHIETAFQKSDGTWKNLHTSNNSKPEPYRFYGFGSEGNGLYRMKVTAYSTLNGLKSSPATVYLSYDTQSPVAYFSPDFANNSFVNSNFHVSGIANDNVKLKNVIFDIRDPQDTTGNAYRAGCVGSSNLLYTNSQKDASLNCDMNISNLVEGHQYIVRIHASDFAGYGGGESRTFTVDKTAPAISSITAANTAKTVSLHAQASTTAPASVETLMGKQTTFTVNLDDGGGSGNYGAYIELFKANHNGTYGTWVTDNTKNVSANVRYGSHPALAVNLSGLNGAYGLKIVGQDKLGNSFTKYVFFTVDSQSPTAHFTTTPPTYVNGNFHVEATAADNIALSGAFFDVRNNSGWVAGCVSGTMTSEPATIAGNKSVSLSCDINTSALVDGQTYTLRVHAGDYAGYGGGQDVKVTVDRTAPTVTITYPAGEVVSGNSLDIKGTVSDTNLKDYNIRIYKSDKSGQVSPGIYYTGTANVIDGTLATLDISTLADGNYWVRVWADDLAGNRTGITSHIYVPFTVDRTAPAAPTINPITDNGPSASRTVSGTAEPGSTVTVLLNGGNAESATTDANGNWQVVLSGLTESTTPYVVSATATDAAGNTSSPADPTQSFFVQAQLVDESETATVPNVTLTGATGGGQAVLGVSTDESAVNDSVNSQSILDNAENGGEVKAATTDDPTDSDQAENDDATKSGAFLGLGWWWLLILAALLAFFWFLAGRKSRSDEA